ncbi:hypothetical protein [uncultured Fibrella sp.]|uniref:hypothetical protein n=1 Tax=uncultured Fibrella sp. TaxID=1284596 RepID=UPI0035CBBB68
MSNKRVIHLCNLWLLLACTEGKVEKFQINLADYHIKFPITSEELQAAYPKAKESHLVFLTDSNQAVRVTWLFEQSLLDSKRDSYGLIMTLEEKGQSIDSVRSAIASRFHQQFESLTIPKHLGNDEYFEPDSSLKVMHLKGVQIAVQRRKIWPTYGYKYTNDVVISICYNRTIKEEERFVFKQGRIHEDDD